MKLHFSKQVSYKILVVICSVNLVIAFIATESRTTSLPSPKGPDPRLLHSVVALPAPAPIAPEEDYTYASSSKSGLPFKHTAQPLTAEATTPDTLELPTPVWDKPRKSYAFASSSKSGLPFTPPALSMVPPPNPPDSAGFRALPPAAASLSTPSIERKDNSFASSSKTIIPVHPDIYLLINYVSGFVVMMAALVFLGRLIITARRKYSGKAKEQNPIHAKDP